MSVVLEAIKFKLCRGGILFTRSRFFRRYFKPHWCMPTETGKAETGKETDIVCKYATPVNDDIDMILLLLLFFIIIIIIIIINQKRLVSSPQVCHQERSRFFCFKVCQQALITVKGENFVTHEK